MASLVSDQPRTLAQVATAASIGWFRFFAGVALLAATAAGAWIRIPLPGTPVPMTLQTLFVLAGAGLVGGRVSVGAQAAYVLLGGIGLPLFAGSAFGAPVFFGPTGGYLAGFILASAWIGWLGPNVFSSAWRTLGVVAAADALILASGSLWLAAVARCSLPQAVAMGVLPFLAGDAIKIAAAVILIRWAGPRSRRFLGA